MCPMSCLTNLISQTKRNRFWSLNAYKFIWETLYQNRLSSLNGITVKNIDSWMFEWMPFNDFDLSHYYQNTRIGTNRDTTSIPYCLEWNWLKSISISMKCWKMNIKTEHKLAIWWSWDAHEKTNKYLYFSFCIKKFKCKNQNRIVAFNSYFGSIESDEPIFT